MCPLKLRMFRQFKSVLLIPIRSAAAWPISCIKEPVRRIAVAKASSSSARSCGPVPLVGDSGQGVCHPARLSSATPCRVVLSAPPSSAAPCGPAPACPAACSAAPCGPGPSCPPVAASMVPCCPEDCCPEDCSAVLCWLIAAPATSPDMLHLLII